MNTSEILNDLGINNIDTNDNEFDIFNSKLESFKSYVEKQITHNSLQLKNLVSNTNEYYEVFYKLETYSNITNKFFDKEYLTHPKERLKKIKKYLEENTYKYNSYLVSIDYKINDEDDIEAYEKEKVVKYLLSEYLNDEKSDITENINSSNNIINEQKKSKLSELLRKMESGESLNDNIESVAKELSQYDKADLKLKIELKYKEVLERAIKLDGEEDGLIKTYVESMFNPEKTILDDKNLLLNLLILNRMQDISIMNWNFDINSSKISTLDIDLKHNWWLKFLSEDIEQDLKYVNIVDKDSVQRFYVALFTDLLNKSDKISYNKRNVKFKKLLSDNNENLLSDNSIFSDMLLKKSEDNSILFITPDIEKHIPCDIIENDDKGQIRYIGEWKKRKIFVINTDKFEGLKDYKNEILILNKGNSFIINPDKPLIYFNVIENPFLDKPLIKWYASLSFNISMDKALRMKIDENVLED